jgi:DNA primase
MFTGGGPRHARHRCLSCGFAGGPNKLVMALLGLKFDDAEAFVASDEVRAPPMLAGVVVTQLGGRRPAASQPAGVVADRPLADWPSRPRGYLEDRGVTPEQALDWGLGYAVDGKLAGRIYFPIHDQAGALRAWTARAFGDKSPKYDSLSLAGGADESVLLGEEFWPPRSSRRDLPLVVVEGPFDALAVDRLDRSVAALRGSDLSPAHAAKLCTWGALLVATDSDKSGRMVHEAIRGLQRHVRVSRVRIPDGHDPASLSTEVLDGIVVDAWRATASR